MDCVLIEQIGMCPRTRVSMLLLLTPLTSHAIFLKYLNDIFFLYIEHYIDEGDLGGGGEDERGGVPGPRIPGMACLKVCFDIFYIMNYYFIPRFCDREIQKSGI